MKRTSFRSPRSIFSRATAVTAAALLGLAPLTVMQANPALADGTPDIALAVAAPGEVLIGETIPVELTVTNPNGPAAYNTLVRAVLPAGVDYVPGSVNPADLGAPRLITDAPTEGETTLIWRNVADVQQAGSLTVGFEVDADTDVHPVGSTVPVTVEAYVNSDPRAVPNASSTGVATNHTGNAGPTSTATDVAAIKVELFEPSPEHELVRGVHDETTTYRVDVTNNGVNPTDDVGLVLYLDAGLEFLGCGGVDNTTDAAPEYDGAPALTVVPAPDGPGTCDETDIVSVDTVVDPPGYPAGVYTRVEWNVGDLATGEVVQIAYRAGIPLNANEPFAGTAPAAAGGGQAANLDNNTGPSTRETAAEQGLTTYAEAAGQYDGPFAPGTTNPQVATDELTVTSEDLAIHKTGSTEEFEHDGIIEWTLTVRTGEYRGADSLVVVDTIPNGLCPLGDGAPAECGTSTEQPSHPYTSVVPVDGGGYVVTIEIDDMGTSDETVVTVPTRARTIYQDGTPDGWPTVGGDSFENTVEITGRSLPTTADPEPPIDVADTSSAGARAEGPGITKTVAERPPHGTAIDCATADYVDGVDNIPGYLPGDLICFTLRVDFPSGVDTRDPVITDFLPEGTSYVAGSLTATGDNTVTWAAEDVEYFDEDGVLEITLGTEQGSEGSRYVSRDAVFEATLQVQVDGDLATTAEDRIRGNLMKLRAINTAGDAYSLRDQADFELVGPVIDVTKGVGDVDTVLSDLDRTANDPDTDDVTVRHDDYVAYRIDVTNNGALPAHEIVLTDVFPDEFSCLDRAGAVLLDGTPLPNWDCATGSDPGVLKLWINGSIAPGETRTITYVVQVPTGIAAAANLVNEVTIDTFDTYTNVPDGTDGVEESTFASGANDPSNVRLPGTTIEKAQTTSHTGAGNDAATQATIGEEIAYTVTGTIPAGTTVHDWTLSDTIPAGTTLVGSPVHTVDGAAPASPWTTDGLEIARPGSFTVPATDDDVVVTLEFTVQVNDVAANVRSGTITNSAELSSRPTPAADPVTITDSTTTTIVEPTLEIDKSNDTGGDPVLPGQTVEFELRFAAAVGTNHSTAYTVWLVDTLPEGVTYVPGSATGSPIYDSATRTLTWNGFGAYEPGQNTTLSYEVTVDSPVVGANTFTNTVTAYTSSLPGGATGARTTGPGYVVTDTNTVGVGIPPVTKTVDEDRRTIGEVAEFTVEATIPAGIEFPDAVLLDYMPDGMQIEPGTILVTCDDGSGPCAGDGWAPGTAPLAPSHTSDGRLGIGWFLGDLTAATTDRTVTLTYSARVVETYTTDVPPLGNPIVTGTVVAGDELRNSASVHWNLENGPDPVLVPEPEDLDEAFDAGTPPATAVITVLEPELTLTKAVADSELVPGESTTYTLTLTNSDAPTSSTAYVGWVRDTLPAELEFVEFVAGYPGTASYTGGTHRFDWNELTLEPGESATLSYVMRLSATADVGVDDEFVNSAQVITYGTVPNEDPYPGRAYPPGDPVTTTVTPAFPQLMIEKTTASGAEPGTAYLEDSFGWVIEVTNTSSVTATNGVITDTLPADWSYDADSAQLTLPDSGTAAVEPTINGSELVWPIGELAPSEVARVTFTATPSEDAAVGPDAPHVNAAEATWTDATGSPENGDGPYETDPDEASALIHSTDLSIDKSHTGDFVAGEQGTFTLTVHNAGPSVATDRITVIDTLPAELTYVSATGTDWTCSATGQVVTCFSDADVAVDADMAPITLTVSLAADLVDGTETTNTAAVTSPTHDPNPDNNEDPDPVDIVRHADLGVVKTVGDVVAGAPVTWTLAVTNHGPSDSDGTITVTDELPAGVTFTSATGEGWSCGEEDGTVTCDLAAGLALDESAGAITLVGLLDADHTGAVTNVATVDGPHEDRVEPNDEDSTTTTAQTSADLAISKALRDEIVAGEEAAYDLTVVNLGPSVARGPIVVTDELPAGLSYVSGTGDGWSCEADGPEVTCTHADDLVVGADAATTFELIVAVGPGVTDPVANTALVSSETPDPNDENDDSTDTGEPSVVADLGVEKSHEEDEVVAGENVTFTLDVTNHGPSDSAGPITVTDVLPQGLTYVSADGVDAADGWSCDEEDGTVICDLAAGLETGEVSSIEVLVTVESWVLPGEITNVATVNGPETDPVLENNTSNDPVEIITEADLALSKAHTGANEVEAGTSTSFTLDVTNDGPSDASGPIVVTDTLPAGTAYVDAGGGDWACDGSGTTFSCQFDGSLAAGEGLPTIEVTVDVLSGTAAGTLTNSAEVDSPTDDPDESNNDDTADFEIVTSADLAITKAHGDGPHLAGEVVAWTIEIDNAGPSDAAADVVVTDGLPEGFTYVATDDSAAWACEADGTGTTEVVTCRLGSDIIAGTSAPTLTLLVLADSALPAADYTNEVEVSSETPDPNEEDNTTTDDLPLTTAADLAITKTLLGDLVIGDEASYRIEVENFGPSVAATPVVTDVLPAGLTYVDAVGEGWECVETDGELVCELDGPLPVGSAPAIELTVEVGPKAYPSVENVATVDSETEDPDPSNNEDAAEGQVPSLADLEITKSHGDAFTVGEPGQYTLTVVNHGPTEEPGVVTVTDTLPAGLVATAAAGEGWTCELGDTVICTTEGLGVDETATITLDVDVLASAAPGVVNTASVDGEGTDPDPSNNTTTDPTDVTPVADLTIVKSLVGSAVAGGTATYSLEVTNLGPSPSVGQITVSDPLPSGLSYVSADGEGWACDEAGQAVTCVLDAVLEVGQSAPAITLETTVTAAAGATVTNTATVFGALGDLVESNNEDAASVEIGAVAVDGDGDDPGGIVSRLPHTGSTVLDVLAYGLLFLVAGTAAAYAARTRRQVPGTRRRG